MWYLIVSIPDLCTFTYFDQYGPSQEKCTGLGFSLGLSQTSWIKRLLGDKDIPSEDQNNSSVRRLYRISYQIIQVLGRDFLVKIHHGGYKCHFCQPPGAGHLAGILPQIWPCSAALKMISLKPRYSPAPRGGGYNDLCLIIGI